MDQFHDDGKIAFGIENIMDVRCEFHSVFKKNYSRNNKKNGKKSIRCFPQCSAGGHRKSSFCGCDILVSVFISHTKSINWEDICFAIGSLNALDDQCTPSMHQLGSIYSAGVSNVNDFYFKI